MDADFLLVVLVFLLGFVAGWHARFLVIIKNMIDNPDEVIKAINQIKSLSKQHEQDDSEIDAELIEIETENHQGVIYAYDKHTGEFIAQGSSEEDLINQAKKRFPNKNFWQNSTN